MSPFGHCTSGIRGEKRAGSIWVAVLVGDMGSEFLNLDLERSSWTRMAEVPRFPDDGGMCYLQVLPRSAVTLLHWELGVLALDSWLNCAGVTIDIRKRVYG